MKEMTPEQRAAGKTAFYKEVMNNAESRRDFLKKGGLAAVVAGGGLGSFYFGYSATLEKPLRVAVLGTGDEGSVLIGAINPEFIEVKAIADIRPFNVYRAFEGDCEGEVAMKARPGLMAKYGWKTREEAEKHVKVYQDYRDLLKEEKDIEAVIIGLPLHLHAPAAIAAMKAGKHVITEKLMGHSVHECKEMGRVAKQTNMILAVGHQRHYNILYENASDSIKRGVLGELHFIQAQWHRGNLPGADSWSMPLPEGSKTEDSKMPPRINDMNTGKRLIKDLNNLKKDLIDATKAGKFDEKALLERRIRQKEAQIQDVVLLKGGDAAGRAFKSVADYGYQGREVKNAKGEVLYNCPPIEELIRWRLWDRTGAGLMAELGSHQLDASSIFIAAAHGGKKQHPLNVSAVGNRPIFGPDRDCEDHVLCVFEFPLPGYDPNDPVAKQKKIGVMYSSINGNGYGGYGETVYGTKGTLILEKEQETILLKSESDKSKVGVAGGKSAALDTQASGAQAAAVGTMATGNVSRGYKEELEHWAYCIRNRAPENQPRCKPEVAMGDAIIALTANKAAREGIRIEFKEEWFEIDNDATPEGVKPDVSRYNS